MQVAVFHPGTQHSWQTALALQQLGRLEWYATSIFYQPDRFPYRLERLLPGALAERARAEFRRFAHPSLDPALVRTAGIAEWLERIAARAGWHRLARSIDSYGNHRFVDSIAGAIRSSQRFALWGYNGSSLSSFELARQFGRTCILDRTIGDFRYYNAMMDEIADRYGDWFLPTERRVSAAAIARDDGEYALADCILVGSETAAQTIRDAAPDPAVPGKLRVLDYCFDEALFAGTPEPLPVGRDRPVRFLFMGLVVPRKGVHHLLEAISAIPRADAELTIVGDLRVPPQVFAAYADRVTYRPTVARADVPSVMREHDVLVLPSYFEGAPIVLYEALASGCALLHSKGCGNAVTPDTGILLDNLDTESLRTAMLGVIEDRERLSYWKSQAPIAAQQYSFANYRENISRLLADLEL
jgi:glycosyltransferase involved in cell wall biosynthesis